VCPLELVLRGANRDILAPIMLPWIFGAPAFRLKRRLALVAILIVASALSYRNLSAQVTTGKTYILGHIALARDVSTVENEAFISTLAQPLKANEEFAAMVSDNASWSVAKHAMSVGTKQIEFPIVAMVKTSDGRPHTCFPGSLVLKVDIKADEVVHVGDFQIESKRSMKKGESLSVILVGLSAMLSIDALEQNGSTTAAAPWFTAYKSDLGAGDRAAAIEAWRTINEHVKE